MVNAVLWLSPLTKTDWLFVPYSMDFMNELIQEDRTDELSDEDRFRLDLSMLFALEHSIDELEGEYPAKIKVGEEHETALGMIQQLRASRDWMVETLMYARIPDWVALMVFGYPISVSGIGEWPSSQNSLELFDKLSPTTYSQKVGQLVSVLMQQAREGKED
tara:strand:+ start:1166 stop:1651 length:486 start_codon:yes stop_codon:yes gene_type:complete